MQSLPGNIVIQEGTAYDPMVDYICNDLKFERVRLPGISPVACGKWTLLRNLLVNSIYFLNYLKRKRTFDNIVVFGHIGILVRLLAKMRIISYSRLFSLGFFVHSPRLLFLMRFLLFDSSRNHYIVFSEHELSLYWRSLRIDESRMHFLRYVQWDSESRTPDFPAPLNAWPGGYYFSGGYSNRDYLPLIEVFRQFPGNLIILCSASNKELDAVSVPPNIRIIRDLPPDSFEAYLQHAKAGILPLKHDTGACGQSVMLRLMRNRKPSIVSDVAVLREYVEDGHSGFFMRDIAGELPGILNRLESEIGLAAEMGTAAYQLYRARFSSRAGFEALRKILSGSGCALTAAPHRENGIELE